MTASLIAIGAMGFTLQFGLTNVLNISYGGAMTVGAFAAFVAEELHLPVALAAALAVLAGALESPGCSAGRCSRSTPGAGPGCSRW